MKLDDYLSNILNNFHKYVERSFFGNYGVFLALWEQAVDDAVQPTDGLRVALTFDAYHVNPEKKQHSRCTGNTATAIS